MRSLIFVIVLLFSRQCKYVDSLVTEEGRVVSRERSGEREARWRERTYLSAIPPLPPL